MITNTKIAHGARLIVLLAACMLGTAGFAEEKTQIAVGARVDLGRVSESSKEVRQVGSKADFWVHTSSGSARVIKGGIRILYFTAHWCSSCHDPARPNARVMNALSLLLAGCGGGVTEVVAAGFAEEMNRVIPAVHTSAEPPSQRDREYDATWGWSPHHQIIEEKSEGSVIVDIGAPKLPGVVVLYDERVIFSGSVYEFTGFPTSESTEGVTAEQYFKRGAISGAAKTVSALKAEAARTGTPIELPKSCELETLAARQSG